jgi:hypothetical protein
LEALTRLPKRKPSQSTVLSLERPEIASCAPCQANPADPQAMTLMAGYVTLTVLDMVTIRASLNPPGCNLAGSPSLKSIVIAEAIVCLAEQGAIEPEASKARDVGCTRSVYRYITHLAVCFSAKLCEALRSYASICDWRTCSIDEWAEQLTEAFLRAFSDLPCGQYARGLVYRARSVEQRSQRLPWLTTYPQPQRSARPRDDSRFS